MSPGKPKSSPKKRGLNLDDVREIALALPAVTEGLSYGTPAFRVKKHFLARMREDGETLAVRISMDQRDLLLDADPEVFFITDHYAGHPAILVRLTRTTRAQLKDLLEDAWRERAPRRLIAELDRD